MSNAMPPSARLLWAPWVLLLAGLALTYGVQRGQRESARQTLQAEFEDRAGDVVARVSQRLHNYEQVLAGVSGLFAASREVSRQGFYEYVQALRLDDKYPGIQGVGFARVVLPQERGRHIAEMRAEGLAQYDIRPPGQREFYTPIVYLEPADWRNQRAIGFDMHAEPVRRTTMDRSRDEASAIISGKVTLVQEIETDVQAGFLMYLPVYRSGSLPQTVAARRASLRGWVYAPFRMKDLMSGVLGADSDAALFDIAIYDGASASDAEARMYGSNADAGRRHARFSTFRHVAQFGRQWTFVIHSQPAFDARLARNNAELVAVGGTLTSVLLALIAWLLVTGRARALAFAQTMTEELRQREVALQNRNRDLRLLSDCNMALVHANDEHKLLAEICRLCVDSGGYVMAWVGYAEHDEARTVRPVAHAGSDSGYLEQLVISWADTPRGRGPTGTAIRTARPVVNQNVLTNPAMAPWREAAIQRGYKSSVALPLICDAAVLGALTMYARDPEAFDADELQLLEELANDLAYGIVALRTRAAHAQAKEKLDFFAHFDPLTHLPNRLLLGDRFERAALIADSGNETLTMLYLDVDRFTQINDSLGYAFGDKVLVMVVERLQQCVPASATISRLSGDEFVVLLIGDYDALRIIGVADAIREAFTEPLTIDGSRLSVSVSLGIAMYPNDGPDFETLFRNAHTAVDSAKDAGRNTSRFFKSDMNASLVEQIRITAGLAKAVGNGELLLHYQPQVELGSGRISGAEALVRWQHPSDGLLFPGKFIEIAERSGHIIEVGEWVLREACRQARVWQDRYPDLALVMAVNLSFLQFKRGNVLEMVVDALAGSGLRPERLELELTESILLQDVEATQQTLRALKALGVKLAIDDFGTGYSSLAYLKHLAVDKLKIDQSFVRDMLSSQIGGSIVKAVIELGHTLQLSILAEGVETDEQRAFLRAAGCDEMQGYCFSRPLPAEQFAQLLGRGLADAAKESPAA